MVTFLTDLSPERQRVAKIIKKHIDRAVVELGADYNVQLAGKFDNKSIELRIEVITS